MANISVRALPIQIFKYTQKKTGDYPTQIPSLQDLCLQKIASEQTSLDTISRPERNVLNQHNFYDV